MKKLVVTDKGVGIAEMPEKYPWLEHHSEAWYNFAKRILDLLK